jgi:NADH-quinone oxidoreductase subunit N
VVLLSAASMLVGNFFALNQGDRAPPRWGFSGIAQMGYVLIGLAARTRAGLADVAVLHGTYSSPTWRVPGAPRRPPEASGGHSIPKLAGLSRRAPALGAALLVFPALAGRDPFVAGFWAKLFVLLAGYRAGLGWLVVLGVAWAVLGLFYYLSVARSTFMAEGEGSAPVAGRGSRCGWRSGCAWRRWWASGSAAALAGGGGRRGADLLGERRLVSLVP